MKVFSDIMDFTERTFRYIKAAKALGIRMNKGILAEQLGVSRTMFWNYEQNDPEPPEPVLYNLTKLEYGLGLADSTDVSIAEHFSDEVISLGLEKPVKECSAFDEKLHKYSPSPVSLIPVVGWAHAGEPVNYDELPNDWNDRVPSTSRDSKAFAVRLEGESMEPKFSEGDLLIVQPSFEAYNGCLAVCRFHDDGVIFRRVEFLPDRIQLIALNPAYPTTQHDRESFAWIYPVFGSWKQIWK